MCHQPMNFLFDRSHCKTRANILIKIPSIALLPRSEIAEQVSVKFGHETKIYDANCPRKLGTGWGAVFDISL